MDPMGGVFSKRYKGGPTLDFHDLKLSGRKIKKLVKHIPKLPKKKKKKKVSCRRANGGALPCC